MRHRAAFMAGAAIGLVVGARAGRERYDQLMKYVHKVTDNPSVRNATKTASQKAGELSKAAGQQAADKLPKLTGTAVNGAKTGADKVRSQLHRSNNDDDAPLDTPAYH
jgi:hypothetical protein